MIYTKQTVEMLIETYIDTHFSPADGPVKTFSKLIKLGDFLNSLNSQLDDQAAIYMVENNLQLQNLFQKILSNATTRNKLDVLDKYDTISMLFGLYCVSHDVFLNELGKKANDSFPKLLGEDYTINIAGLYLGEIRKPLLSADEQKELAIRASKGDMAARNMLIERNLRLVIPWAKRSASDELTFLDLVQEGNMGLIEAVDKFDVSKGTKFSTYATLCIRNHISRAIVNKSRSVKLSFYKYDELKKYRREKFLLKQNIPQDLSIQKIAEQMQLSLEKVVELEQLDNSILSLNEVIEDEYGYTEIEDLIPAREASVENSAMFTMMQVDVQKAFRHSPLKEREINILKLHYGLDSAPMTLEEIGKQYNVTHEAIRQAEERAIKKLRHSPRFKALSDYIGQSEEISGNGSSNFEFSPKQYIKHL